MIVFNKQNLFGKETEYIEDAFKNNKISGDGKYTKLCSKFLEEKFVAKKVLLTTSCTHSLEMAALLCDIKDGDEFILPSYTFVSTANAFVLRGAKPVFCDIRRDNLNIDEEKIEELITAKTRAIIPVHYMGVSCEMDKIMSIAKKYNLYVIEDAAQGVNSKYKDRYLGTIGDMGTYSFHETKNYSMGEGGALLLNNERFLEKAEIIREKGTNRSKFFRGEIKKYSWVEKGSSYLPSDINAGILWNQLEYLNDIKEKRRSLFYKYYNGLREQEYRGNLVLAKLDDFLDSNFSGFYIFLKDENVRKEIIEYLKRREITAVFHYIPLHQSDYFKSHYQSIYLPVTEEMSLRILRLPMYYSLTYGEVDEIIEAINLYFSDK